MEPGERVLGFSGGFSDEFPWSSFFYFYFYFGFSLISVPPFALVSVGPYRREGENLL